MESGRGRGEKKKSKDKNSLGMEVMIKGDNSSGIKKSSNHKYADDQGQRFRVKSKGFFNHISGKTLKHETGATAFVYYRETTNGQKRRDNDYCADAFSMGKIDFPEKKNQEATIQEAIQQALRNTVRRMQEKCKGYGSGTTLTFFYFHNDNGHKKAYVCSVGDSPIFKQNEEGLSEPLVKPHDTKNILEKERVQKVGGVLDYQSNALRVGGRLNVTRSIGGYSENGKCKLEGVTSAPEIKVIDYLDTDRFFLSSDGMEKEFGFPPRTGIDQLRAQLKLSLEASKKSNQAPSDEVLQKTTETFFQSSTNQEKLAERDDTVALVVKPQENCYFLVCDGHGGVDDGGSGRESSYEVSNSFGLTFNQELSNILEAEKLLDSDREEINIPKKFEDNVNYYVSNMANIYQKLHPVKGSHSGELVGFCRDFLAKESLQEKYDFLKSFVKRIINNKNINEYVKDLNSNNSSSHFHRLVLILFSHFSPGNLHSLGLSWLNDKNLPERKAVVGGAKLPSQKREDMNLTRSIENGKKTRVSQISTLFSSLNTGSSSRSDEEEAHNQKDPYVIARGYLTGARNPEPAANAMLNRIKRGPGNKE